MSSNIRLEKLCQHCGVKFIAKTSVTQYCGDKCAKLAYKKRKRDEKIRWAPLEKELSQLYGPDKARLGKGKNLTVDPGAIVKDREFFSITQTSVLLGISERTLFRMINREQIRTTRIGGRILIKKSELLPYFS
ncbi:MAG: helix-turn-helix domain-containing protein [Cyclobacteriaceae bacterium]|nr:helix-turn-helix domain-containing protein [Cyclobacteriaceae bacterium]